MSVPSIGQTTFVEMLTKIALLQLFNETPSPPAEYLPPDLDTSSTSRVLPFIKEKELVETLAFLASVTDDPGKVVAVCVEEGSDHQSMTTTLAVNNGDLGEVVVGFRRIAAVLQRIARKETVNGTIEAVLLQEVITLSQSRILCRLRSKHAVLKCRNPKAKMERPKIIPTLAKIIAKLPSCAVDSLSSERVQEVKDTWREMNRLFEKLENLTQPKATSLPGVRVLSEIILASHRLCRMGALQSILKLGNFADEQKMSICRTIEKLSRYHTASTFLREAASRFSVFSRIMVLSIKRCPSPLPRVKQPSTSVQGIMASLFSGPDAILANSRFRDRLKKKKLQHTSFSDLIFSTKYVVHAEIQLLFHYELHQGRAAFPPRVICSGKMACFLCNLFLKAHGKYFIPSTHGRVYEKWTLPKCLGDLQGLRANQIMGVIERFNAELERVLKREILMPSKVLAQPNESHVYRSAVWTELGETQLDEIQRIDSGHEDGEKDDILSLPESKLPVCKSPMRTNSCHRMLTRGQQMSFELAPYTHAIKVSTPHIHLTFSYDAWEQSLTSLTPSNIAATGCRLSLVWVEAIDEADLGSMVIDLAKFPENFQETFDRFAGSCDFFVKKRDDVVRIMTTYLDET